VGGATTIPQSTQEPKGLVPRSCLRIRRGGQVNAIRVLDAGEEQQRHEVEKKAWEFAAVDKSTVLELRTAMPPTSNGFGGPAIDDVKVVEID